jgi:hypothetical protein
MGLSFSINTDCVTPMLCQGQAQVFDLTMGCMSKYQIKAVRDQNQSRARVVIARQVFAWSWLFI